MGVQALRHTCAALLIAQGAHPKAIQSHLGHRSITTTLDRYGHLFEDEYEKLAKRIDAAYSELVSGRRIADPDPNCTCPFPVLGMYDTLDTVELVMGMKTPATMRDVLLADARRSPIRKEDKRAWTHLGH